MKDYQKRVEQELHELTIKIEKLRTFMYSDLYKTLPYTEQILLQRQHDAMIAYQLILEERIDMWEGD